MAFTPFSSVDAITIQTKTTTRGPSGMHENWGSDQVWDGSVTEERDYRHRYDDRTRRATYLATFRFQIDIDFKTNRLLWNGKILRPLDLVSTPGRSRNNRTVIRCEEFTNASSLP